VRDLRSIAIAWVLVVGLAPRGVAAHEGHTTGPHPTATTAAAPSAGSDAKAVSAPPSALVFRVRPEARADLGWTGISHGQAWPAGQRIGFTLDCSAGGETCKAGGGGRGDVFGSPIPLASGGVPACIVNRLRTAVSGTVQPVSGCGELALYLTSTVFLGNDVAHPCPTCRDDPTPNDGKKDGRCVGGATDGQSCDVNGTTKLFGGVSNDCVPPQDKNAGELTIDLAPLTTGESKLEATLVCKAAIGKDAARCFCAAQTEANACSDGRCDGSGRCKEAPLDGACSGAPYRGCLPGTGKEGCENVEKGSGECIDSLRPCFGETLTAHGQCDPQHPTYAAVFCAPQTRAAALNATAGLPGPARVVLPLERVR
jgi:hypothetical protein